MQFLDEFFEIIISQNDVRLSAVVGLLNAILISVEAEKG
jgi:hypothetical protein